MSPTRSDAQNYETLRDCVSELLIAKLSPSENKQPRKRVVKGRKNEIKPVVRSTADDDDNNDAADLSDTIEYLATEIFDGLPVDLQTLTYETIQNDASLAEKYSLSLDPSQLRTLLDALPPSVEDSLISYGLLTDNDPSDLPRLLDPVFSSYIASSTSAPPDFATTRATKAEACEICDREQLPLTYHHLIPRAVHAKAVKRGWHASWELNRVAWLCRPCHSFVHRVASNEELAKEWYSVELILEREDVRKWALWVSKIRWKKT